MHRCLLLLLCLLVSASDYAECRSEEGQILKPVYEKRIENTHSYLALTLKAGNQIQRYAVMNNMPVNLVSRQLFPNCIEEGSCMQRLENYVASLSFGSEYMGEKLRPTFQLVDDDDIELLLEQKSRVRGILGPPFLEAFQWQFHDNQLKVYKDCNPYAGYFEGDHLIRIERYDLRLPGNPMRFIGDVIYGHISSDTRYDRNLRLTFSSDPRLYMMGKIAPEKFKGIFSQFTHLQIPRLLLGDSKRYGDNELHDLYLQSEAGSISVRPLSSAQFPVLRNISATLRPSREEFPPHLQMSLSGLAQALNCQLLWFRLNGDSGLRLSGMKSISLTGLDSGQAIF